LSFDELEEDIEPLLGREVGVELVVSRIGFLKTVEQLEDAFHRSNFTTLIQTVLDNRFHRTLR
jgi:hypothetical protein